MRTSTTLLVATLITPAVGYADAPMEVQPAPELTAEQRWLEEVRAQRKAWEARRKAAKSASDTRLRMLDPWGAAKVEAWRKDTETRREALQERADKRREELHARDQALEKWHRQITPHGWDNRWYYRGY